MSKLIPRRFAFERFESRRCLTSIGFAQFTIEATEIHRPGSIVSADVDSDGDLDLITSSVEGAVWHENLNGGQQFRPPRIIDTQPGRLHVADLNGDSVKDLVIATDASDSLLWYRNGGRQFAFDEARPIGESKETHTSIVTGDIDGDGDLDVVAASADANAVAWYENLDGRGTFGPWRVITNTAEGANAVDVGDLDGDGDLDVVATSPTARITAWYENRDGQGAFGDRRIIDATNSGLNSVDAVDLDGDGDLDLVVGATGYYCGKCRSVWYVNSDGLGTFRLKQNLTNDLADIAFAPADLDGDGDVDLAMSFLELQDIDRPRHGSVGWYENTDGLGALEFRIIEEADLGSLYLNVADINQDGHFDIITTLIGGDRIEWYDNVAGDGSLWRTRRVAFAASDANDAIAIDMDSDGDLDVLMGHRNTIVLYENLDGDGLFSAPRVLTAEAFETNSLAAADLDDDGDYDIVTASSNGQVSWFENIDGKANFGPADGLPGLHYPETVTTADMDGDGDLDVVVESAYSIVWSSNRDGQEKFGPWQEITRFGSRFLKQGRVVVDDLDGDGDLDVPVSYRGLSWYPNDNEHQFNEQIVIDEQRSSEQQIVTADMDGDGDIDLLASFRNNYESSIGWYENTDGLGTFGPRTVIAEQFGTGWLISVADVDSDGDEDIISTLNSQIVWYENDGFGSFGTSQIIANTFADVGAIFPVDIDGDGDLDVLATSFASDQLVWFQQRTIADVNDDGIFNSSDLVKVFQAGQYEDSIPGNSTFDEGDWNQDGDFTTADLVFAFQVGGYVATTEPTDAQLNDVAAAVEWLFDQGKPQYR